MMKTRILVAGALVALVAIPALAAEPVTARRTHTDLLRTHDRGSVAPAVTRDAMSSATEFTGTLSNAGRGASADPIVPQVRSMRLERPASGSARPTDDAVHVRAVRLSRVHPAARQGGETDVEIVVRSINTKTGAMSP